VRAACVNFRQQCAEGGRGVDRAICESNLAAMPISPAPRRYAPRHAPSDSSLQFFSLRIGARRVIGGIATTGVRHENIGASDTYQHYPCRVCSCSRGGTARGICRRASPRFCGPAVWVRIRSVRIRSVRIRWRLRRPSVSTVALTASASPPPASPAFSLPLSALQTHPQIRRLAYHSAIP
jgi:hypothetical protein